MVESQISLRSWSDQKFLLSSLQKFVKSIFFKCFSCPHCKSLQKFLSSELQRPTSSSSPACPRHAQDTRCLVRLSLTTIIITLTTINIITTTTITNDSPSWSSSPPPQDQHDGRFRQQLCFLCSPLRGVLTILLNLVLNELTQSVWMPDRFLGKFIWNLCFQAPTFFKGLLPLGKDKVVLGELFWYCVATLQWILWGAKKNRQQLGFYSNRGGCVCVCVCVCGTTMMIIIVNHHHQPHDAVPCILLSSSSPWSWPLS